MAIIFQTDSDIIKKTYSNYSNYEISYNHKIKSKSVAIYFSSNGIYFPNTEKEFKKTIIKRNRYEWSRNKIPNCHKHIFVRDINKQWYLNGINKNLNNIEKLENFLREETREYKKITTTGCSSGGFAAMLFGISLNADKIFNFNGQYDLNFLLQKDNCKIENPIIHRNKNNPEVKKYLNLEKKIENFNGKIYYFVSLFSKTDKKQIEIAKKYNNIIKIYFKESKHGLPFDPFLLKKIMILDKNKIEKLSEKHWERNKFSFEMIGLIPTIYRIFSGKTVFYFKKTVLKIFNTIKN